MPFVFYSQLIKMDCGPTCLRMIAKYYGKHYTAETLRQESGFGKDGVSLLGLCETAEKLGFLTRAAQISFQKLTKAPLPAILHWNRRHFVVLLSLSETLVEIANPAKGILSYSVEEFEKYWVSDHTESTGTVLFLEPTAAFYKAAGEKEHAVD